MVICCLQPLPIPNTKPSPSYNLFCILGPNLSPIPVSNPTPLSSVLLQLEIHFHHHSQ